MEYKYFQSLCLMARGVTHDYNNIFTGLSGQLNLIAQEATLGGGVSEHRLRLVNDLLAKGGNRTSILYEFSRYNHTEKAEHSLDRILELAAGSLNILSRLHQFVVADHAKLPRLHCRIKDMVMMLFYLGENALEATPEGGTIDISAEMVNDGEKTGIVLSVSDGGRGIPPAVRSRLFQPFVTTKTSNRGLKGLGLYAARNIVREHGGFLSYTDDTKNRTVFSARLPLPCEPQERTSFSTGEPILPTAPRAVETGRRREIFFVIEDDEAMRDLVVRSLQRRGHVVFSAETCGEAVEDFELVHEAVTVLLIDVGLTDSDGFECLKQLLPISSQAKVIFMSGEPIVQSKYRKYGASFLKKPFTAKEIEELVSHHE